MKTIIVYIALAMMGLCTQFLMAQEKNIVEKVEELEQEKKEIIRSEKEALKKEVEAINEKLAKEELTIEKANGLKEEAAKNRALNIENRIAILNNKIELLKRNGSEYLTGEKDEISLRIGNGGGNDDILLDIKIKNDKNKKIKYDKRTYSNAVVAFGLNNVIVDGQSLDDSDYKIIGSRFFEIGWAWKTRVFKNSNILRIKYGISYQSNGLKPTDNRYFVENEDQTNLEEFRIELDKSKFRMENIVIPVHMELGASKAIKSSESIRYTTRHKFRIGLGGYVGANISTRQKLKYKENGERVKEKIKRDYNTSDLIYGLSAYIGFSDMSVYAKYDLSTIFKDSLVDQNNVSLGLRFDL
ncbi:hypothetical protein [Aquimarina sp. RZ0]|uniref:hypothetical protein n=1 Tax=Aquimarina sp. RZ0 TaxID=2607730 RepID=UPI0011F0DFF7|nr:hypothetical protein [Aquimarina sp. RZ0]KAA1244852.1 hypothetical protein F0000_14710 [Aquimarina sp. RZ0]